MNRLEIPSTLHKDFSYVLLNSHRIIDAIFEEVASFDMWGYQYIQKQRERQAALMANRKRNSSKGAITQQSMMEGFQNVRIPLKPSISIIQLSQFLSQTLNNHDNELYQLPHFTNEEVRACRRKKVDTILKFKRLSQEERAEILETARGFDMKHLDDIEAVCSAFPDVELSYFVETEDENEIIKGDVVSITIRLKRLVKAQREQKKGKSAKLIREKVEELAERTENEQSDSDSSDYSYESDDYIPPLETKKTQTANSNPEDAPFAHTPNFPYPKREK